MDNTNIAGRRKRILFTPTLGFAHVTRSLMLAKELAGDFDVRVSLSREFVSLAEELQIDTQPVDLAVIDYEKFARGEPMFETEEIIEQYASVYGAVMDEYKPDCVVSSMPLAVRIPIQSRGIPHVTIFDACNHPKFGLSDELPPEQLQQRMVQVREMFARFNAVAKRHNASEGDSLRAFFTADFNLIPDLPTLFPIDELPEGFVFMGPVTWKGADKPLDPTVVVDPDKPLVYVSMGSSGNREHMKMIAKQLRDSPYQVVITTGGVIEACELQSYERPGFYVRDFLAGDKVMALSKETVVICHGGIGTVYQALEHEVRGILVMPAHWQHKRIGNRLAEIGLGKLLTETDLSRVVEYADELQTTPKGSASFDIKTGFQTYVGAPLGKEIISGFMSSL